MSETSGTNEPTAEYGFQDPSLEAFRSTNTESIMTELNQDANQWNEPGLGVNVLPHDTTTMGPDLGFNTLPHDTTSMDPDLGVNTLPHDSSMVGVTNQTNASPVSFDFSTHPSIAQSEQTQPQQAFVSQTEAPQVPTWDGKPIVGGLFDVPSEQASPGTGDGGTIPSTPALQWPSEHSYGVGQPGQFVVSGSEAQQQANIPAGADTIGMGRTVTQLDDNHSVVQDSNGTTLYTEGLFSSTATPLGPNQAIYTHPFVEPGDPPFQLLTRDDSGNVIGYQNIGRGETMATMSPLDMPGGIVEGSVAIAAVELGSTKGIEMAGDALRGDSPATYVTPVALDGGTPSALNGGISTAFGSQIAPDEICPVNDPTIASPPWLAGSTQEMMNGLFDTSGGSGGDGDGDGGGGGGGGD
jgi:hypothetical protein